MPAVVDAAEPDLVVWSSLWPERPEAVIRFDLPRDATGFGTDLTWTLELDEPRPDGPRLVQMGKTINQLINANLRETFDQ